MLVGEHHIIPVTVIFTFCDDNDDDDDSNKKIRKNNPPHHYQQHIFIEMRRKTHATSYFS